MSKLTRTEKETIINYNDAESVANIYSCNKNMIKKLLQLEKEYPDKVSVTYRSDVSLNVEIPKDWIKISAPRKLTDKQREAARERMLKNRKNNIELPRS